jgi:hypothetical protein
VETLTQPCRSVQAGIGRGSLHTKPYRRDSAYFDQSQNMDTELADAKMARSLGIVRGSLGILAAIGLDR